MLRTERVRISGRRLSPEKRPDSFTRHGHFDCLAFQSARLVPAPERRRKAKPDNDGPREASDQPRLETIRDTDDAVVSSIGRNGEREVRRLLSLEHEAEYGADGQSAFPGNDAEPENVGIYLGERDNTLFFYAPVNFGINTDFGDAPKLRDDQRMVIASPVCYHDERFLMNYRITFLKTGRDVEGDRLAGKTLEEQLAVLREACVFHTPEGHTFSPGDGFVVNPSGPDRPLTIESVSAEKVFYRIGEGDKCLGFCAQGLSDIELYDPNDLLRVVKAYVSAFGDVDITMGIACPRENETLFSLAEHSAIINRDMVRPIDWPACAEFFLKVRAGRISPLQDGLFRLGVEGVGTLEMRVEGGIPACRLTDAAPDAAMSPTAAQELLFSTQSLFLPRGIRNWLPLPCWVPDQDGY